MFRLSRLRPVAVPTPLVVLPVIAGGCVATPAPADPVMPTPPTGWEAFDDPQLAYGGCDGYATTEADDQALSVEGLECARLTVPLDYLIELEVLAPDATCTL